MLRISIPNGVEHWLQSSARAAPRRGARGRTGRLVEMGEGGQVIGCLEQWRIAQWGEVLSAVLDLLDGRVDDGFLHAEVSCEAAAGSAGTCLAALILEDELDGVVGVLGDGGDLAGYPAELLVGKPDLGSLAVYVLRHETGDPEGGVEGGVD